jgi:DNA polymerase-4
MPGERTIAHVDMDAFFAAVEQRDHPELRGKPVLVGHDGPRGVVATASYEARPFGCRSAMPMAVAKRLCPQAIVVPVKGRRYGEVSRQIFDILDRFAPVVEPMSVDEAFCDLTGTERLLGDAVDVARRIKQAIHDETQLTASIGLAANKFLAKLASDMDKPDGLTVVPRESIPAFLAPLPIERMWGVGKVTAERLHLHGIRTFGDAQQMSIEQLTPIAGNAAEHLHRLAHGIDDRPVHTDREAKSISQETTFDHDIDDPDTVRTVLLGQTEQVAGRLRKAQLLASSVTVKIRYGDFETITRSLTLNDPTDATDMLWQATKQLYDKWVRSGFRPVRLIGMGAARLGEHQGVQQGLFADPQNTRRRQLDNAVDQIRDRFGTKSIHRGG